MEVSTRRPVFFRYWVKTLFVSCFLLLDVFFFLLSAEKATLLAVGVHDVFELCQRRCGNSSWWNFWGDFGARQWEPSRHQFYRTPLRVGSHYDTRIRNAVEILEILDCGFKKIEPWSFFVYIFSKLERFEKNTESRIVKISTILK